MAELEKGKEISVSLALVALRQPRSVCVSRGTPLSGSNGVVRGFREIRDARGMSSARIIFQICNGARVTVSNCAALTLLLLYSLK